MHTANIPEQDRQPVPEYQTSLDFAFFLLQNVSSGVNHNSKAVVTTTI